MSMFYEFTLTGATALLFHADIVENSDLLKEWRTDPANANFSVKGDDRSPPWTWQTYLYHDGSHLAWPSDNLSSGFRQAGAQVVLKGAKTFKELAMSGIILPEEYFQFTCNGQQIAMADIIAMKEMTFKEQYDACLKMGFRLFMKRAKVGSKKHVRVRARFDSWEITGRMEIFPKEITEEVLLRIMDIAGRLGQGDWRAGCKTPGPYGRYVAKLRRMKAAA